MFSQATVLMALAASASAHMTLNYPVPYGQSSLTSAPLGPGDFPCKQRSGVYDVTKMNQWNAGETQTVSFTGSAVHGGGSCQFSLTSDPKPSESSEWKVIHSVIGGCPSNVTGNLPDAPQGHGAATFPVTMPKDIPDGQYTFAWTWLNKVGNREFYMNCAPVQVGSGSGSASTASSAKALSALPDMFVANIGGKCTTPENLDFEYPNPGQSVVIGQGASTAGSDKVAAACGVPSSGTPSTPNTPSQPAASSKPSATAPSYQVPAKSPAPVPANSGSPSSPGGIFAPGASSAPASKPTAQPAPPAAKPQPSAKPEAPQNPNNTAPVNGECTPCTNDGAVVCIGSKQFGLCNRGCAVAQDLAQGMACANGVVVAATKRHVFPRAHLHRRFSAARML